MMHAPSAEKIHDVARTSGAPHRGYWLCQLSGWSLVYAINMSYSTAGALTQLPALAVIYAMASIGAIGLSHAWRGLLKRKHWFDGDAPLPWLRVAIWLLLFGLLLTGNATLMFAIVRPEGSFNNWGWVPMAITFWTLTLVGWTMIYVTVQSRRRAARLQSERLRLDVLAKDAELRALQSQINPHFFFNSLNSLRALIYENPNAASGMVDQLAGLMRYTLTSGEMKTVTLKAEIDAVNAYLAIEKIRFEERLRIRISVDPQCEQQQIPPMALQTLVENAVKYGVERNPDGSDVVITATREGARVRISVTNAGAIAPFTDSTRLGVVNTQKRIALLMGESATLNLAARDGNVIATLDLPAS